MCSWRPSKALRRTRCSSETSPAGSRGRARVPKYDGWDFLLAPSEPMALARGGCFYTIETPEDGNETLVRRYKIIASKGSQ